MIDIIKEVNDTLEMSCKPYNIHYRDGKRVRIKNKISFDYFNNRDTSKDVKDNVRQVKASLRVNLPKSIIKKDKSTLARSFRDSIYST